MRPVDSRWLSDAVREMGPAGVVGVALLAFAGSFALSALLPSWQELERHRAIAAAAREGPLAAATRGEARDDSPAAQLRRFYEFFPAHAEAPAALSRLYAAAAGHKLALPTGEYASSIDPRTGLARYEIVLPVRGSYAQVRQFVEMSLQQVPTLAVDQVSFERPRISEAEVQARIHLTLYLRGPR